MLLDTLNENRFTSMFHKNANAESILKTHSKENGMSFEKLYEQEYSMLGSWDPSCIQRNPKKYIFYIGIKGMFHREEHLEMCDWSEV